MFAEQTWVAKVIWALLAFFVLDALFQRNWPLAFVALITLLLSMAPVFVARWADLFIPPSFIAAIVVFIGGTLFLGEVFDFYYRFWWWDLVMHGGSAIGFGLIGFVLVFMMFQGDRYAAPPFAVVFCILFRHGHRGRLGDFRICDGPDIRAEHAEKRPDGYDVGSDHGFHRRGHRGQRGLCLSQMALKGRVDGADP